MYFDIIYNGYRYTQRSETSIIKQYDLDGKLIAKHEEIPERIKKEVEIAQDVKMNPLKYFEYSIDNNEITITKYNDENCYIENVEIPSSIEFMPVTKIANHVFANKQNLKYVKIPNTVHTLEQGCFMGCENLQKVVLSNQIKEIPAWCFHKTSSLYDINLDNIEKIKKAGFLSTGLKKVNLSKCKAISYNGFSECENLESINISNVTLLGEGVFAHNKKLKEVILSKSLKEIPKYMCFDCSNLEKILIPKDTCKIGYGAFFDCNLKTLELPEELEIIDNVAFAFCKFDKLDLPKALKSIGKGAFASCYNLKSIKIPDLVNTMDEEAFSQCRELEEITLSKKLYLISKRCFFDCSKLKKIDIPENIKKIEDEAFLQCINLKSITMSSDTEYLSNAFDFEQSLLIKFNDKTEITQKER